MNVPNGYDEIVATFGDVQSYVQEDGTLSGLWQTDYLAHATLPFSLPLDWNRAVMVDRVLCHKLLVGTIEDVFRKIVEQGLQSKVLTYGGCFMYRMEKKSVKLSTHAWGIALDLNPSTNQQGTPGDMDAGLVAVFTQFGFEWGGGWPEPRTDAMHFEFCRGY